MLNPNAKGAEHFRVDPQLLKPAEDGAHQVAQFLDTLSRSLAIGPPPGAGGFATAVQIGALAQAWNTEILDTSKAAEATGAKIALTRGAYEQAERENHIKFTMNG